MAVPEIKEQTSSLAIITVAYWRETLWCKHQLQISVLVVSEISCDSQAILLVEWHITHGGAQSPKATCIGLFFCLNFTWSKYHANHHSLSTQTAGSLCG